MKGLARWFSVPFGSLKMLAILAFVLFLGRMADLGSTYWFLSQSGFDLTREGNHISRMLFTSFGFFGSAVAQLFVSWTILLLFSATLFYLLRELNLRLAKIAAAAILISSGVGYIFIVTPHNFGLFRPIYLALPSYYTFVFSTYWILILLPAVVLFLYGIGYGKEKIT